MSIEIEKGLCGFELQMIHFSSFINDDNYPTVTVERDFLVVCWAVCM